MLFKLSDMQRTARSHRYAIPHVLGGNLEMAYGAVRAAQAMDSPLAIGLAMGVFSSVPLEMLFPLLLNIARRASVPVAVQLEHGTGLEQVTQAMEVGVNSIMFDGSALPYEQNVARTREIVGLAHGLGVCVEAELGHVGGTVLRHGENSLSYKTDPDSVEDFIKRTGVDSLAVSFGNVHGPYRGEPVIDLVLIERIVSRTDVPLVMHGGSGLPDDIYRAIVAAGISNIHFYSGIAMYAWESIGKRVGAQEKHPPYHEIVSHGIDFFDERTRHVIGLLGSQGRAGDFNG